MHYDYILTISYVARQAVMLNMQSCALSQGYLLPVKVTGSVSLSSLGGELYGVLLVFFSRNVNCIILKFSIVQTHYLASKYS